MKTVTFATKTGQTFVGIGKDLDRARVDAKRKAGDSWDKSAKPIKIDTAV